MEYKEIPLIGPVIDGAVSVGKKAIDKDPLSVMVVGAVAAIALYIWQEGS